MPEEILRFSRAALQSGGNILPLVPARTLYKHQAAIRRFLNVKAFDKTGRRTAARAVLSAAETMDNPAELINVAVEELIKERYELPAFSTLNLLVRHYRNFVNRRLFSRIYNRFSPFEIQSLDALLEADRQTYRTHYNRLKELPERQSLSHLQQLLDHHEWLASLVNAAEKLNNVPQLGRAVRAIYLLKYISDPELREEVHAQTNKVKAFNGFVRWFYFGGESTIWENDAEEQDKAVKYNTLIADAVVFQNVIDQTRIIEGLIREGLEISADEMI